MKSLENKLAAIGYVAKDSFDSSDETKFRMLVAWLEDQKIRFYKEEERAAGDQEEERRERQKQGRLAARSRPKSFGAGLAQGTGLSGLADGIKGLIAPMLGAFGGVLGGMSIGGLLGTGIGYLFRVGIGVVLGKEYLQPLIDKMLPDFIHISYMYITRQ